MKERAEEYPDLVEKKRLLGIFTRIVEVTQSLFEQQEKDKKEQDKVIAKSKKLPDFEPIRIKRSKNKPESLTQEPRPTPTLHDKVVPDLEDIQVAIIPNVNEKWPTYLWKDVQNAKQGSNTFFSTPIEEL